MQKKRFGVTNQSYLNTGFTLIIVFFFKNCVNLLNHVENKKSSLNRCYNNIAFIITHIFNFIEIFISPVGFEILSTILSFHQQDSLEHFLQGRSSGNELPQLSYMLKCLDSSLTFEEQFYWVQDYSLTGFFLSTFSIHCPLSTCLQSF